MSALSPPQALQRPVLVTREQSVQTLPDSRPGGPDSTRHLSAGPGACSTARVGVLAGLMWFSVRVQVPESPPCACSEHQHMAPVCDEGSGRSAAPEREEGGRGGRGQPAVLHHAVQSIAQQQPEEHVRHVVPAQHDPGDADDESPEHHEHAQRDGQDQVAQDEAADESGPGGMARGERVLVTEMVTNMSILLWVGRGRLTSPFTTATITRSSSNAGRDRNGGLLTAEPSAKGALGCSKLPEGGVIPHGCNTRARGAQHTAALGLLQQHEHILHLYSSAHTPPAPPDPWPATANRALPSLHPARAFLSAQNLILP